MYFANFSEALHMAGHGPYVWVSYAATLLVMIILVWWPAKQRRKLLEQQRRVQRINANSNATSPSDTQED